MSMLTHIVQGSVADKPRATRCITAKTKYSPSHWCKMVAVSLAYFIFDEIMRPSVTTYVSEGLRITLRYTNNGFLDIH